MAKTTCCNVVQGQTNNPFQYPPQKNIQAVFTAIPKTNEGQATVTFSKCKDQPCPDEKEESKASKNETSASHPEQGATETAEGSPEKRDKNEGGNTDQATDLLAPDQAVGSPSQQVGIGPEFYKMSGAQKFCVLKEHLNCLICQFKKMSDSLPVNQIASKVSSKMRRWWGRNPQNKIKNSKILNTLLVSRLNKIISKYANAVYVS